MTPKNKMTTEQERDFYKQRLESVTKFFEQELHPYYGPCDANGQNGLCSVCVLELDELIRIANGK